MRVARLLILLLLPLALIAGCGSGHGGAGGTATGAAGAGQDDGSVPADPAGTSADAQPIDQSCPTSNTTAFAKTKFVLHAGLAFGAFHRYLYKPFKAGTFNKGAKGRILAFVKGGAAALFVKREVRLASEDVKANPTLCKAIAAPLATIGNSVQGAFDKLKGGDPSAITGVNSQISSVEGTSGKAGDAITENENADLTSSPS